MSRKKWSYQDVNSQVVATEDASIEKTKAWAEPAPATSKVDPDGTRTGGVVPKTNGWYDEIPLGSEFNFTFSRADACLHELERKGIMEWSALTNYQQFAGDVSPLKAIVWGSDGKLYTAKQESGPDTVALAQDPTLDTTRTYWAIFTTGQSSAFYDSDYSSGTYTILPMDPDVDIPSYVNGLIIKLHIKSNYYRHNATLSVKIGALTAKKVYETDGVIQVDDGDDLNFQRLMVGEAYDLIYDETLDAGNGGWLLLQGHPARREFETRSITMGYYLDLYGFDIGGFDLNQKVIGQTSGAYGYVKGYTEGLPPTFEPVTLKVENVTGEFQVGEEVQKAGEPSVNGTIDFIEPHEIWEIESKYCKYAQKYSLAPHTKVGFIATANNTYPVEFRLLLSSSINLLYTETSGIFEVGDEITSSGGATGEVTQVISSGTGTGEIVITRTSTTRFFEEETITGAPSGATGDLTAVVEDRRMLFCKNSRGPLSSVKANNLLADHYYTIRIIDESSAEITDNLIPKDSFKQTNYVNDGVDHYYAIEPINTEQVRYNSAEELNGANINVKITSDNQTPAGPGNPPLTIRVLNWNLVVPFGQDEYIEGEVKLPDDTVPSPGDIEAGYYYNFIYDNSTNTFTLATIKKPVAKTIWYQKTVGPWEVPEDATNPNLIIFEKDLKNPLIDNRTITFRKKLGNNTSSITIYYDFYEDPPGTFTYTSSALNVAKGPALLADDLEENKFYTIVYNHTGDSTWRLINDPPSQQQLGVEKISITYKENVYDGKGLYNLIPAASTAAPELFEDGYTFTFKVESDYTHHSDIFPAKIKITDIDAANSYEIKDKNGNLIKQYGLKAGNTYEFQYIASGPHLELQENFINENRYNIYNYRPIDLYGIPEVVPVIPIGTHTAAIAAIRANSFQSSISLNINGSSYLILSTWTAVEAPDPVPPDFEATFATTLQNKINAELAAQGTTHSIAITRELRGDDQESTTELRWVIRLVSPNANDYLGFCDVVPPATSATYPDLAHFGIFAWHRTLHVVFDNYTGTLPALEASLDINNGAATAKLAGQYYFGGGRVDGHLWLYDIKPSYFAYDIFTDVNPQPPDTFTYEITQIAASGIDWTVKQTNSGTDPVGGINFYPDSYYPMLGDEIVTPNSNIYYGLPAHDRPTFISEYYDGLEIIVSSKVFNSEDNPQLALPELAALPIYESKGNTPISKFRLDHHQNTTLIYKSYPSPRWVTKELHPNWNIWECLPRIADGGQGSLTESISAGETFDIYHIVPKYYNRETFFPPYDGMILEFKCPFNNEADQAFITIDVPRGQTADNPHNSDPDISWPDYRTYDLKGLDGGLLAETALDTTIQAKIRFVYVDGGTGDYFVLTNPSVGDIESRLTAAEGNISTNTTNIGTNTTNIGTNSSSISGLDGRVTTIEGEIDALQAVGLHPNWNLFECLPADGLNGSLSIHGSPHEIYHLIPKVYPRGTYTHGGELLVPSEGFILEFSPKFINDTREPLTTANVGSTIISQYGDTYIVVDVGDEIAGGIEPDPAYPKVIYYRLKYPDGSQVKNGSINSENIVQIKFVSTGETITDGLALSDHFVVTFGDEDVSRLDINWDSWIYLPEGDPGSISYLTSGVEYLLGADRESLTSFRSMIGSEGMLRLVIPNNITDGNGEGWVDLFFYEWDAGSVASHDWIAGQLNNATHGSNSIGLEQRRAQGYYLPFEFQYDSTPGITEYKIVPTSPDTKLRYLTRAEIGGGNPITEMGYYLGLQQGEGRFGDYAAMYLVERHTESPTNVGDPWDTALYTNDIVEGQQAIRLATPANTIVNGGTGALTVDLEYRFFYDWLPYIPGYPDTFAIYNFWAAMLNNYSATIATLNPQPTNPGPAGATLEELRGQGHYLPYEIDFIQMYTDHLLWDPPYRHDNWNYFRIRTTAFREAPTTMLLYDSDTKRDPSSALFKLRDTDNPDEQAVNITYDPIYHVVPSNYPRGDIFELYDGLIMKFSPSESTALPGDAYITIDASTGVINPDPTYPDTKTYRLRTITGPNVRGDVLDLNREYSIKYVYVDGTPINDYFVILDLETQAAALVVEINELENRIDANQNNITNNDGDIAGLTTRMDTAEGNITSNDGDISGLDTRLTTAEGNITSNDGDISGLDTRLTTAEGDIDNTESRLDALDLTPDGRVTVNEGRLDALDDETPGSEGRVTVNEINIGTNVIVTNPPTQLSILDRLIDLDNSAVGQEGRVTVLELNLGTNQIQPFTVINRLDLLDRITEPFGRVKVNEDDIDNLETRMTTAEGNISSNDTDISGLDTRVTTNEGDISGLDTRVTTAEGNISSNDTDIAGLDTRVTTAEGNITSNDIEIGILTSAQGLLDTRVTALDNVTNGRVTLLDNPTNGRVKINEDDIDVLQTDVADLQSQVINTYATNWDKWRNLPMGVEGSISHVRSVSTPSIIGGTHAAIGDFLLFSNADAGIRLHTPDNTLENGGTGDEWVDLEFYGWDVSNQDKLDTFEKIAGQLNYASANDGVNTSKGLYQRTLEGYYLPYEFAYENGAFIFRSTDRSVTMRHILVHPNAPAGLGDMTPFLGLTQNEGAELIINTPYTQGGAHASLATFQSFYNDDISVTFESLDDPGNTTGKTYLFFEDWNEDTIKYFSKPAGVVTYGSAIVDELNNKTIGANSHGLAQNRDYPNFEFNPYHIEYIAAPTGTTGHTADHFRITMLDKSYQPIHAMWLAPPEGEMSYQLGLRSDNYILKQTNVTYEPDPEGDIIVYHIIQKFISRPNIFEMYDGLAVEFKAELSIPPNSLHLWEKTYIAIDVPDGTGGVPNPDPVPYPDTKTYALKDESGKFIYTGLQAGKTYKVRFVYVDGTTANDYFTLEDTNLVLHPNWNTFTHLAHDGELSISINDQVQSVYHIIPKYYARKDGIWTTQKLYPCKENNRMMIEFDPLYPNSFDPLANNTIANGYTTTNDYAKTYIAVDVPSNTSGATHIGDGVYIACYELKYSDGEPIRPNILSQFERVKIKYVHIDDNIYYGLSRNSYFAVPFSSTDTSHLVSNWDVWDCLYYSNDALGSYSHSHVHEGGGYEVYHCVPRHYPRGTIFKPWDGFSFTFKPLWNMAPPKAWDNDNNIYITIETTRDDPQGFTNPLGSYWPNLRTYGVALADASHWSTLSTLGVGGGQVSEEYELDWFEKIREEFLYTATFIKEDGLGFFTISWGSK